MQKRGVKQSKGNKSRTTSDLTDYTKIEAEKRRRQSNMSTSTNDSGYSGSLANILASDFQEQTNIGAGTIVHMHGILSKKPFGHQSSKWSRRFFILKEGFMFYYAESEKKLFETKPSFNIHPKGVVPLGYCQIEETCLPGFQYGINIHHPDFKAPISLAADSEHSQREWIQAMDRATRITLENAQLGETMIRSLQDQSLQLARERQEYIDKFISEAEELGVEREQREALEVYNTELANENARIEALADELQKAYAEAKLELNSSLNSSLQLEEDRAKLKKMTDNVQQSLADLSNQRSTIISRLQDSGSFKKKDDEVPADLTKQLAEIEQKAQILEEEKSEISKRLEENIIRSHDLEHERESLSKEAEELRSEIQELNVEKQVTQEELKNEVLARMKLQKELEQCKDALQRLEKQALRNTSPIATSVDKSKENEVLKPTVENQQDEISRENPLKEDAEIDQSEQIRLDVKSLREFFENCANGNKIEPDTTGSLSCPPLRGASSVKRKSLKRVQIDCPKISTASSTSPAITMNGISENGEVNGVDKSPVVLRRHARGGSYRHLDRRSSVAAQEATNVLLRNANFRKSFAGLISLQNRNSNGTNLSPTQNN